MNERRSLLPAFEDELKRRNSSGRSVALFDNVLRSNNISVSDYDEFVCVQAVVC